MRKTLSLLLALALVLGIAPAVAEGAPDTVVASSVYGWVLTPASVDDRFNVTVEIMEVPSFEKKVYTTAYPLDHKNEESGAVRANALAEKLLRDNFVEILLNAAGEVIDFCMVEQSGSGRGTVAFNYYHDSARFGGELTAPGGGAGRMVAEGWILKKDADAKTITIGDGNHVTNVFEETYTLADDCQIFVVDNGTSVQGTAITGTWGAYEGTFDNINLCPVEGDDGKCPGEIYYKAVKYNALCIFDGDYTTYDNGAKVNELYLFKNPLVLADSLMVQPDGMTYDGLSWIPAVSAAEEEHGYGFDGSCVPFEVLANRLYSIGDSYTNMYLFVGDDGSTGLLDLANTNASYQYWLNIAACGYDPREIDYIVLTHGHGDHYNAAVECVNMINRYQVGQGAIAHGEQYPRLITSAQDKEGSGYLGYPEITPALSTAAIRYMVTDWDVWETWANYGGGVELYPFLTTGHEDDVASFLMLFTATANDKVFKEGEKIGFAYMGGYGATNNFSGGYTRLAYVDGLRYIQSVAAPYLTTVADYVYNIPQHSNQYPWYETWKASQMAGIPFMEGLQEGLDAIQNFCEKRISYVTYEEFFQAWKNKTDEFGNLLEKAAGIRCSLSSSKLQTIETYGPYKRPAGEYELEVISASVLHGFDCWQNPNEKFAGLYNIYGFELSKGLVISKDSIVHDPNRYFVQIVGHVKDDYNGKFDFETNWNKDNYISNATSGPVEIANRTDFANWTEIVRTVRVDSLEEAQALLNAIEAGKTYKVQMNQISEIEMAGSPAETFVPVN